MAHFEFERKAFDDVDLYFQGWQNDEGTKGVICLVHGLGEHSGRYAHWAGLLNQAGYTVLTYDIRGHGKSGGPRGHVTSFNDYLEDTGMLLKEAGTRYPGLPRFLYGHSIGAIIVSDYVLRRKPDLAGVIITASSNKNALQDQSAKNFLVKMLGGVLPKLTMPSGLDPSTISKDASIVSAYKNDPMVHNKVTLAFAKASINEIAWVNLHACDWTLPILVMHGEEDRLAYASGSRDFASKICGDRTVKIWPHLWHEIHNEPEKAEVFEFLRDWLDSHCVS